MKLYHGTNLGNLWSIINDKRLIADKGYGVGVHTPGLVFLATTIQTAYMYAHSTTTDDEWWYNGSEPCVILEVDVDENNLLPDPDDCKDCKNWQESSKKRNQVVIKNYIDLNPNTTVYFIGGNMFKQYFKTTLKNAKEYYNDNKNILYVQPVEEEA